MELDLREQLNNFLSKNDVSQAKVSRALGVSASALNQWLFNEYKGNVDKITEAVKSFLIRQEEKESQLQFQITFCHITATKKVWEVARICHLDNEIGIIYSDAGLGKTVALKEYAKLNPDVVLIEATLGYTTKVVFSKLHKALGLDGLGSINSMFEEVVEKLKYSGRLIIIDEAEHLPYRSLELLRRIYDMAGVGIMLAGMPRLLQNIKGLHGQYRQLYSRVGIASKLEILSQEDVETILKSVLKEFSNSILKAFYTHSRGNGRTLSKLIKRSLRIAELNDKPLDSELIKETARLLII